MYNNIHKLNMKPLDTSHGGQDDMMIMGLRAWFCGQDGHEWRHESDI